MLYRLIDASKSAAGGAPISRERSPPMDRVYEVLRLLAAIASIGRFLLELRRTVIDRGKEHKQHMDDVG